MGLPAFDILSGSSSVVVGFVFWITGITKALDPRLFTNHWFRLRLLPDRWIVPLVISFTLFEGILGSALVLQLFPQWILPGTIILLIILSIFSFWSVSSGRVSDCGCYGGVANFKLWQSLLLNGVYIGLLAVAWWHPFPHIWTGLQQRTVLGLSIAISTLLLGGGHTYYLLTKQPLMNLETIRPGLHWQAEWFPEYANTLAQGAKLAVFLSPTCPACKNWIFFLTLMHKRSDFPDVIAGLVGSEAEIQEFLSKRNLPFPVVLVDRAVSDRLISGFPTGVLLQEGVIQAKWVGVIPKEFVDPLKRREAGSMSLK